MAESAPQMRADARRNREQVMAAARDLFAEQGVDAPLEDIARRAGVGIATLYRRFPDRAALVRAVVADNLAHFAQEAERARYEEPGAWQALQRMLRIAVNRRVGVMLVAAAPYVVDELRAGGEVREHRRQVVDQLERMVAEAQRSGDLRGDIGLGDIAVGLVKLSRSIPVLSRDFDDQMAQRQVELFLDALRPPHAERPSAAPMAIGDLDRHLGFPDSPA